MAEELQFQVMRCVSERLSATLGDLAQTLGRPEDEVRQAVMDLEKRQLIHRAVDPIKGQELISPTSMGLLNFRKQSNSMAY